MITAHLQSCKTLGLKILAILVDPDSGEKAIASVLNHAIEQGIELFLVGGSLLSEGRVNDTVIQLKNGGAKYVILFPGNEIQLSPHADALLFMALISGRNPEFLIGKQVVAAPWVKKTGIETIPTGYMLIESGRLTSANYMSHTLPIPADKPDIAVATALAGEYLGMRLIYMDAGSGAKYPIPAAMIRAVAQNTQSIIFIGGGIRSAEEARSAWMAGADVIVVGNGCFDDPGIIAGILHAKKEFKTLAT